MAVCGSSEQTPSNVVVLSHLGPRNFKKQLTAELKRSDIYNLVCEHGCPSAGADISDPRSTRAY